MRRQRAGFNLPAVKDHNDGLVLGAIQAAGSAGTSQADLAGVLGGVAQVDHALDILELRAGGRLHVRQQMQFALDGAGPGPDHLTDRHHPPGCVRCWPAVVAAPCTWIR